ncbi:MAG: hypothetical protein JXB33_04890 [Clostridia bacterium]|nr:hypothetical protein [Clostridia bacterium]
MTENNTVDIINKVYGYEIINAQETLALKKSMGVILSELGIEPIYEFLSYDITEYSEARKTIHARRFYQLFKPVFSFTQFNMETFHKIQAGCLFISAISGIMRGYDEFEYSGFVREVLNELGRIDSGRYNSRTVKEKLLALQNLFDKFGHVSIGIYSLQIFTKFGMAMQKLNKTPEGYPRKLLDDIMEDINNQMHPIEKIRKLLSLEVATEAVINDVIDEYLDYAVSDISAYNISTEKKKSSKAKKGFAVEISAEVRDFFNGYKREARDIRQMTGSFREKLFIFDENPGNKSISVLYTALLDRLVRAYDNLRYYEEVSFVKQLNMIFINRIKELLSNQRKQEMNVIRSECIRIIENNITGMMVYELDGVLAALSVDKDEFDDVYGIDPEESETAMIELDDYLDANLDMAGKIQDDMRANLKRILNPELMGKAEKEMLQSVIYDFNHVLEFLSEDEE